MQILIGGLHPSQLVLVLLSSIQTLLVATVNWVRLADLLVLPDSKQPTIT
jgi:hypothetical protein